MLSVTWPSAVQPLHGWWQWVVRPLNIGGKAWWKFLKILLLCTDEISKISQERFGLQQAWVSKVKMCLDCPPGLQKNQICLDRAIRPPPQLIFIWTGHLALKNSSHYPRMTIRLELLLNHSISILSALLTSPNFPRPFLHAPTTAFTAFRTSWSFACNWLKTWISVSPRLSIWPSWLSVSVVVRVKMNVS